MIPIATLLGGYRTGYFPMAAHGQIGWYSPERRGVIPLEQFKIPRRLARVLRQGRFQCSLNRSFRDVIAACASREDTRGNWIDDEIFESYCALHQAGHAHSVEVWDEDRLVGGLYGVTLRGAFFGESMFHRVKDTSKVALCFLVDRLLDGGFRLLDLQWITPHLRQFGAVEISRARYLTLLAESMQLDCQLDGPRSLGDGPVRGPNRSGARDSAPGSSSSGAPSARCAPSSRS
ncbi:MAG: leucyl/phenylalanyl-tRNA--protein transferase [Vicinamibacterales bacterium]|jgi:leucyl/phenylalanyl-tRNA--protein transferase|nr:leucyl/phenylalanyl-tRNA--protein transferase [Vicinamibacterales bacterium]